MACSATIDYVVKNTKFMRPFKTPCEVSYILERLREALRWRNIDLVGGFLVDGNGNIIEDGCVESGNYSFVGFKVVETTTRPSTPETGLSTNRITDSVHGTFKEDPACLNVYYTFRNKTYVRLFKTTCDVPYMLERLRCAVAWQDVMLTGGHLTRGNGAVVEDVYAGPGSYWFVGFKELEMQPGAGESGTCLVM
jgi:hypothetical protein